jgi:hypothetical protein
MSSFGAVLPECGSNPPGFVRAWWAHVNDIAAIPPASVSATTLSITTDITMVSGKKFQPLFHVRDDSDFSDEMVGTADAAHFMHQISVRIKGQSEAVEAALNDAVGCRCVVLVEFANGDIRVIGNKTNYAEITELKSNSGKFGGSDRKGSTMVVKSVGHQTKCPFYTGDMTSIVA